ncbi:endonuclease [Polaribacter undariae]|uniref:Endonuclease n=1 Tax=Polaribacter sejongensis TaxID=985043 RepID=A0AAJ1QX34_9FLAO|nr:endonuclease [Polaribacter undariae]MDN3619637.1 endonuclease [Polaribacter undariae]UWD33350.1 endonuclease [Polaribacter undariae]
MKKNLLLLLLFLTTIISAQEQYYNGVNLNQEGLALKEELANKTIAAHTNILSYGWPALQATDVNPENDQEVLLIYGYTDSTTGTTSRRRGIDDHGGDSDEWNREHVYAKSLGTPNLGTSGPGADGHHLRPSDVGFNSQRGSLKFADGSGNAGTVSGGWYPGDEWKGDVARIMMYMYIRYADQCKPTGVGIGSTASTPDDMIDLFLEWNVEDPVSDFERQRNTYHDSREQYAQGNRNPFIDNAYLATRIWGGDAAVDSWGIYTSNDDKAPTVPTNVVLNNITTSTIDATWSASTDNEAVTKYEVYANEDLNGETATTSYTLTNLNPNTTYAITVLAKDIANNGSAQSTAVNATTLTDNTPPTIPTNVTISNISGTSFKVNWNASTDDTAVTGYEVYLDGVFNGTTTNTNYTITGLTISTTYSATVLAKDAADNKSAQSTSVSQTTTDGSAVANELFFSEYVEGGNYRKAIEIVNLTGSVVDLSIYSIARQSKGSWETPLALSGFSLSTDDVFVITNSFTENEKLKEESDLGIPNQTPMTFNGDDRIGLFKNGNLIDIIGDLDGTSNFAKDVTLRRLLSVTNPNTTYTTSEWEELPKDTVDGIGIYNSATADVDSSIFNSFKMYPNPTDGNAVYFKITESAEVNIYNVLGKLIKKAAINTNNNSIDTSNLAKGIYLVKINSENQSITKKLIKN